MSDTRSVLDIDQIADDIAGLEGVTSTHTPVMPLGEETICIILIGRGADKPVCWMSPHTLSHTIIGRGDARTKEYHDEVGLLAALSAILDRVDSGHYDLR